ncbi:hypothetical protein G3A39_42485 [Paraburkholderia aspalathi]|nr:hypothetical protein [Paraburkholderia aspalathi]
MQQDDDGDWIRYEQTAAMLAEKANEIVGFKLDAEAWKQNCFGWKSAAQSAQAELAQIKAQVPVAYFRIRETTGTYVAVAPYYPNCIPLYAAPVASEAETIEETGWRDMATAPLNGRHCILAVPCGSFIYSVQGAYQDGRWNAVHQENVRPLCWMPNVLLPDEFRPSPSLKGASDA